MKDSEDPAYILDYRAHPERDTLSCANLVSLIKGMPGERTELGVYVVPGKDQKGKPILATATISPDKKTITVRVPTGDGLYTFTAEATQVMHDMNKEHHSKNW